MNAPITFNTLAFVRRMEASGMDSAQAEALADALREVVFETTATSAELREVESRMSVEFRDVRADIKDLDTRTRADLRELELRLRHDLTVRLGGTVAACTALTVAILGALISFR